MGQALAITFLLITLDLAQHGAQSLVGNDGALRHAGSRVEEDAARERLVRMTDFDLSVLVLMDAAALTRKRLRLGTWFDEVHDPLVADRQIPRKLALLLPGEDQVEILVVAQRTVRVMRTQGLATESLVVVGAKLRQVDVAGLERRDRPQAKLLHESILKRQVSALDTTLGLGQIGRAHV